MWAVFLELPVIVVNIWFWSRHLGLLVRDRTNLVMPLCTLDIFGKSPNFVGIFRKYGNGNPKSGMGVHLFPPPSVSSRVKITKNSLNSMINLSLNHQLSQLSDLTALQSRNNHEESTTVTLLQLYLPQVKYK